MAKLRKMLRRRKMRPWKPTLRRRVSSLFSWCLN
jgi:hypothetical protein